MRHPKQHRSIDKKFPHVEITGADNFDDMLAAARKVNPGIEFIKLDAEKELKSIKTLWCCIFKRLYTVDSQSPRAAEKPVSVAEQRRNACCTNTAAIKTPCSQHYEIIIKIREMKEQTSIRKNV